MKQGKSAQIKAFKHQNTKHKFRENKKLAPFDYNEFAGFLRARFFLTKNNTYQPAVFEAASFFLDDLIATMVQQNFSAFTSDERVIVNLNEAMQATLVQSTDRDWRYFVLLTPVLYDIQAFLAKEGQVSPRYGVQTTKFDPNFWKMIMRTVMAVNYFRFQGQDVAKLMSESSAIDDLQFKFLKQNGDADDFDLETIQEVFRGLTVTLPDLKNADAKPLTPALTADQLEEEIAFGKRMVETFQKTSTAGVVSDQEMALLQALHQGLAEKFQADHHQWTASLIATFVKEDLFDYWQPVFDSLDGLGGEITRYLQFLASKKAVTDFKKMEAGLTGVDHYLDVAALNKLLGQLTIADVEELVQEK
ncbi:metaphase chromosome protein 1 [Fructobacillus tropaeoli]|uniref:Metaphase chromosome protein 1 n=1 Tax=Fructobacillus tropaeoli TaxID=709323 RepID=A0ABN9YX86_9LACO|nr:metaphase chromosome protein 1 [Fructobacillus tropaeoli]GIC70710.1 hypothetical protein FT12353_13870 [Fructobacillus tropaeoli]CAK1238928.1 hypothetical protein R55227_BLOPHJLP_00784 [Fructobacillus tropaeoli]CAK1245347.1 hypothetical protein R53137_KAKDMLNK_01022 [Fructobacillus tropaeoli]